jgi:DNA repair exonuclease SbcCD ATPase subunit
MLQQLFELDQALSQRITKLEERIERLEEDYNKNITRLTKLVDHLMDYDDPIHDDRP